MKSDSNISIFQGASLITGLAIGSGVMAVPFFFVQNHFVVAFVMVFLALLLCAGLNLMLAEVSLRSNKEFQIVELMQEYLFTKAPSWVMWLVFISTILNFYLSLLAFTVAGTDILLDLTSWPVWVVHFVIFLITALPILFGLKSLAISESVAVVVIIVIITVLTLLSINEADEPLRTISFEWSKALALYAMSAMAFIGFVSIPQVVTGMKGDGRRVSKAIILGLSINLFLVLAVAMSVSITCSSVSEVAIIGWSRELGGTARIIGTAFVLLAIVTSYWGTAYGAAIIFQQRIFMSYRIAWALVVVPVFIVAFFANFGFIQIMQATTAILAVMLITSIIPMYRSAVANTPNYIGFALGKWGGNLFQILIVLGFVLVVVGSIT